MNKSEFFSKLKKFFSYILPEAAIILGAFIVDIVSKTIVENTMEFGQTIVLIPKFLNFCYTINKRAAFGSDFGLGKLFGAEGVLIFFIIVTLLAVGFFGYLLFKKPKKGLLYRIAFSLIIAGALGNLFDRIFCEGVRDFIQFEYFGLEIFGSTTFAIFNIADSCVVVGAILLIIYFLFLDKSFFEKQPPKSEEQGDLQDEQKNSNGEMTDAKNEISLNSDEQNISSYEQGAESTGDKIERTDIDVADTTDEEIK